MTTKEERVELRKELGRTSREELLQLLLEAWVELDALDASGLGPLVRVYNANQVNRRR